MPTCESLPSAQGTPEGCPTVGRYAAFAERKCTITMQRAWTASALGAMRPGRPKEDDLPLTRRSLSGARRLAFAQRRAPGGPLDEEKPAPSSCPWTAARRPGCIRLRLRVPARREGTPDWRAGATAGAAFALQRGLCTSSPWAGSVRPTVSEILTRAFRVQGPYQL